MKKLFYFLLLLTFATAVQAQSAPSGSAGTYYKMFYKSIDKLKVTDYEASKGSFKSSLSQAKQHLASVKKYDPDFDASQMEKDLKQYDDVVNAAGATEFLERDLKALEEKMEVLRASKYGDNDFGTKYDYAEARLETLKSRTPSYDASAYDKELAALSKGYKDAEKSEKSGFAREDQFNAKFNELLGQRQIFSAGTEADLPALKDKVSELDKDIAAFVESDLASVAKDQLAQKDNSTVRNARNKINEMANNELEERDMKTYTNTLDLELAHASIQGYYAQAKGINKLYGTDPAIKADFQKIDRFVQSIPSLSSLTATTNKNRSEMIEKQRMTPAVDNSPTLTAEFKKAFIQAKFSASNQIVAIHITSSSWTINRNVLDQVVSRTKYAEIAVKESDGKCYLYPFAMVQDYSAGSYGPGRSRDRFYRQVEILCENVK